MKKHVSLILLAAVLLTTILFSLDKGPFLFTLPSIIGYFVVGSLYTAGIFLSLFTVAASLRWLKKVLLA